MEKELEYQLTDLDPIGYSGRSILFTDKTKRLGLVAERSTGGWRIGELQKILKFGFFANLEADNRASKKYWRNEVYRYINGDSLVKMLQEVEEFMKELDNPKNR